MAYITERLREAAQGEEFFGFDGMRGDPDPLLTEAADEIDRLRARVAELEAVHGEPVAWRIDYPPCVPAAVLIDALLFTSLKGRADYVARKIEREYGTRPHITELYTAPPAPRVDVDAISASFDGWYTSITVENWDHKLLMKRAWDAALGAIFNGGSNA